MAENKFTYVNTSNAPQTLMGYGKVLAGETITTDEPIENPNFKQVDTRRLVGVEGPVKQPEPNETLSGVEGTPHKGKTKK